MCGRFTREYTWREVHDFLDLKFPKGVRAAEGVKERFGKSYNVAPTQMSPIAHMDLESGEGEINIRRWGLVPTWADDPSIGNRMINARAESAATKPGFRKAFLRGRCVVPVSSFFEWKQPEEDGPKQPYRVHRADGSIMLLAGLFEPPHEHAPDGSFTIITTAANAFMSSMHDRMPAILEPESVEAWCDPSAEKERASDLLGPAKDGVLDAHPVSRRVNKPANDEPSLVESISTQQTEPEPGEQRGLFE